MEANLKKITITPEYASELLKFNTNNRNLRPNIVEKYAKRMRGGEWVLSNDAITISKGNVLLNGQHRLSAVVKSGVACPFLVFYGAEDKAYDIMDRPVVRSMGDVLFHRGRGNYTAQASTLTALAGLIEDYTTKESNKRFAPKTSDYTEGELINLYERFGDRIEHYANFVDKTAKAGYRIASPASVSALCVFVENVLHHSSEKVEEFVKMLFTDGVKNENGTVAYVRKRLVLYKMGHRDFPRAESMRYVYYAWNCYVLNKHQNTIKTTYDAFRYVMPI